MQPMETPLIDAPEIEYLDGQPYPKVSPRLTHALVQAALIRLLGALTEKRGVLVPELRVDPGAGAVNATEFVPDVSFISYERLASLNTERREKPPFSPDIAIEVRSPSDDLRYLQRKIARYLSTGSLLVLDVDPALRCIAAHTQAARRTFTSSERFAHDAFPWLTFEVAAVFSSLDKA